MRLYNILYTFQMSDIHEFSNDSEDKRAAEDEEGKTLAASDSWIGLANSTPHRLKVKTYSEYVRDAEASPISILVSTSPWLQKLREGAKGLRRKVWILRY